MNCNKHNKPPYEIVAVHGGPGAAGSLTGFAKELSGYSSVFEPFQTAYSLYGQLLELKKQITEHCKTPVTLIGHSWGAWLTYIYASKFSAHVKKLILIGAGAFEERYNTDIEDIRKTRLTREERQQLYDLNQSIVGRDSKKRKEAFSRMASLMVKADSYDLINNSFDDTYFDPDIYQNVWLDADLLRKSGKLLNAGKQIICPVVIIHGEYDPHPYKGVIEPLEKILPIVKPYLLEKCGHYPWNEMYAKDEFYQLLAYELFE